MSSFEDLHAKGIASRARYSMAGLILGLVCIIGGTILGYGGVAGKTKWTAKAFGFESTLTDAPPGVILFVVGIFVVLATRPRPVKGKIKTEEEPVAQPLQVQTPPSEPAYRSPFLGRTQDGHVVIFTRDPDGSLSQMPTVDPGRRKKMEETISYIFPNLKQDAFTFHEIPSGVQDGKPKIDPALLQALITENESILSDVNKTLR
jgi:hypothetical protein